MTAQQNRGPVLLPVLSVVFLAVSVAAFTFAVLLSRHRYDQSYQWAASLDPEPFVLVAPIALLIGFTLALRGLSRAVQVKDGRLRASIALLLYVATVACYVVMQLRFNW